jgi:PTH1 family peptidyl-tRNA hydrolase
VEYASCIAGLGNPGREYRGTRHNLGFAVIDALLEECARSGKTEELPGAKFKCALWRYVPSDLPQRHLLVKPLTFMNLSGDALAPLLRRCGIPARRLLVLHDELDFASGRVKLKFGGGSAGHNGLKSIMERIGTPDFHRLRIGIGRPVGDDATDRVLGRPAPEERRILENAARAACGGALLFMREGADAAARFLGASPVSAP